MKKLFLLFVLVAGFSPAVPADNPPSRPQKESNSRCLNCCCFKKFAACHADCAAMPRLSGRTVEVDTTCLTRKEVKKMAELVGNLNSAASWMNTACVHLCDADAPHKH